MLNTKYNIKTKYFLLLLVIIRMIKISPSINTLLTTIKIHKNLDQNYLQELIIQAIFLLLFYNLILQLLLF